MAYNAVSPTNVVAGKPVTEDTMDKLVDNQDDFNTRIDANAQSLENKYADSFFNGAVKATISGGTDLLIEMKDQGGTSDPSVSSPIEMMFRSSTATTGTYVKRSIEAATTLTIPSGGTLGGTAAGDRFYIYLIDNVGTPELAISRRIYDEFDLVTTTAISASSTSDSTIYSTTSRSNVAVKLIGRVEAARTGSDWTSVTNVLTTTEGSQRNMETFTGSTISDNQTPKECLQELETALESNDTDITNLKKQSGGLSTGTNPALVSGWNTVASVEIYTPTGEIFLNGRYKINGTTTLDVRFVIDSAVAPDESFNDTDQASSSTAVEDTTHCYWSTTAGTHTVKVEFNLVGSYVGIDNQAICNVVGG